MPKTTSTYRWDNDLNYSDNFSFETKFLDFGTTDVKKNIYRISLSFGFPLIEDGSTPIDIPSLDIFYRKNLQLPWSHYGTALAQLADNYTDDSDNIQTKWVDRKIDGVHAIQFKFAGYAPRNFIVNDLSIEYRLLRNKRLGGKG